MRRPEGHREYASVTEANTYPHSQLAAQHTPQVGPGHVARPPLPSPLDRDQAGTVTTVTDVTDLETPS